MSESYRRAIGRRIVSRTSAEDLGPLTHLLFDLPAARVVAIALGIGKKAGLIDWSGISGFGPDAILVVDEGAVRGPMDERERDAVDGKLDLLGKRTLTELGSELGIIADVIFDPRTGVIERLQIGDHYIPAATSLGSGTYALVVDATQEPVP
jgi:uncharacterized protein YrrD